MKERKFLLMEWIFDVLAALVLFFPGMYQNCVGSIFGSYRSVSMFSFIDVAIRSVTINDPKMFGLLFMIPLALGIVLLTCDFLSPIKIPERKLFLMLPLLNVGCFLFTSYLCAQYSGGSYRYHGDLRRNYLEMGPLFYVMIMLLLVALFIHCLFMRLCKENCAESIKKADSVK